MSTSVGFGPACVDPAFFDVAFFDAARFDTAFFGAAFLEAAFFVAALVAVAFFFAAGAIGGHGIYGAVMATHRERRLAEVAADVSACRACPRLVEWREQVAREKRAAYTDDDYWGRGVPAFGDPEARVAVIGLAPAAHGANRTGRMFTGDRSGDWLYRAMHRAGFANQPTSVALDDGLRLTDAIVTSPVKCAPPANKPTNAERDTCRPFLDREIEIVDPVVFIALGGFAYQGLTSHFGIRPRPKFGHGVEVPIPPPTHTDVDGGSGARHRWILCSYHVSQQNTFTGRLTEEMLDAVFTRAAELAAAAG